MAALTYERGHFHVNTIAKYVNDTPIYFPFGNGRAALPLQASEHHLSHNPHFSPMMGLYFAFWSGIPCTKFGMPKPAAGADLLPPRREKGLNAQAKKAMRQRPPADEAAAPDASNIALGGSK
ncbi:hypothetical protein [Azospirillum sp. TSO22-1]|uniref:hypothetical protein n=1 Tax=Azospirillum sp. TSO22-1 TaxID=716789 RepID=UPI0011B6F5AC|nr:hypothetical protein [Azospirillum sp. TSO22-1]